jgi:hypothetical protein
MQLWMSGELQSDIGEAYRSARKEIESKINEYISSRSYGEGVQKWAFIAIIAPPRTTQYYPEVRKYWKRDRTAEFRILIDYEAFKRADPPGHRTLIAQALIASLQIATRMNIPNFDPVSLMQDVLNVARVHGWLSGDAGSFPG